MPLSTSVVRRVILAGATSACVLAAAPAPLQAQAWVPPKGEGSISLLFQDLFVEDHLRADGSREDRGQVRSSALLFDMTYGVTDRLAVSVGLPFVRARYSGASPHPNPQDDGRAHYGFQDVRAGVRYNLLQGAVIVTPFVSLNMPSHGYQTFAHAAYGRHVRELEVGAYIGRTLGARLPDTFVQTRYSYSFAQRIAGVHHDRSNLDVELVQFVTPRLRAFVLGAGQKTHGGIDLPNAGWRALPPAFGPHHDRIARTDMLDIGGGIQYSIRGSVDLFGSYVTTIAGRNGHALGRGLTVGASWTFGQGLHIMTARNETTRSLVKCLCQKGK